MNIYEREIQEILGCDAEWAQTVYKYVDIDLSESTTKQFHKAVYEAELFALEVTRL